MKLLANLTQGFGVALAANLGAGLFSLVRTRGLSDLRGPADLGFLSQVLQVQLFLTTVLGLALWGPLVRILAQTSEENESGRVLGTALTIQVSLMAFGLGSLALGWSWTSEWMLGSSGPSSHEVLIFLILAVPLQVFSGGVLQASLHQKAQFKFQQICLAWSSFAAAALCYPLIKIFGFQGALLSLMFQIVFTFLSYTLGVYFFAAFPPLSQLRVGFEKASALLKGGRTFLLYSLMQSGVPLIVRHWVIEAEGLAGNGILQGAFVFSSLSAPIWISLIWGRIYPALCAPDSDQSNWRPFFLTLLGSHLAFALMISLAGDTLSRLVLGPQFEAGNPWIFPFVLSDTFQLIIAAHSVRALAKGHDMTFLAVQASYFGLSLATNAVMIPRYGAQATVWTALFLALFLALVLEIQKGHRWILPTLGSAGKAS